MMCGNTRVSQSMAGLKMHRIKTSFGSQVLPSKNSFLRLEGSFEK
jgi:hypothetical protein